VVFARLALPVLPEAAWSMFGWSSRGPLQIAGIGAGPASETVAAAEPLPSRESPKRGRANARAAATPGQPALTSDGADRTRWHWSELTARIAITVWLGGALAIALRLSLSTLKLHQAQRTWHAPSDSALIELFDACRQQLGIRRDVSLWISDDRLGPATLGWLRPAIVMPRELIETLGREDLRLIVLHELIHVRRCDVPIDRLACLVTAVHWSNPLAWLALVCLRRSRELACDVTLLDRIGADQARHYGHLILGTIETLADGGFRPAAVGILGRGLGFALGQRIRAIAAYRRPSRSMAAVAGGLIVVLVLVGLTDAQTANPLEEKLLADRVAAAQLQFDRVRAGYEAETVTLDLLLQAASQLETSELAVAKTNEARIAARLRYLGTVRQIEEKIEALYRVGARGGEVEKYAMAKLNRQTAEIGLIRQQLGLPPERNPVR